MDGDFVKKLILFDPNIPCTECLIRPVCSTPCNNLYAKARSWGISKHSKYLEWMFGSGDSSRKEEDKNEKCGL